MRLRCMASKNPKKKRVLFFLFKLFVKMFVNILPSLPYEIYRVVQREEPDHFSSLFLTFASTHKKIEHVPALSTAENMWYAWLSKETRSRKENCKE